VNFLFPAQGPASAAFFGRSDRLPVNRIYCVGRNYAAHAREMGSDPDREPPFFFQKPADALVEDGSVIPYPPATENLHHEVELVVAVGREGAAIDPARALEHVIGYGVGIDLTRRDLQLQARNAGRPWEAGKAFDRSAPLAPLRHVDEVGHPTSGRIWIDVDGQRRQDADISDLIWSVPQVIGHLSLLWTLRPGDLIFTGTPEGVGAIARGQRMEAGIDGLGLLNVEIGS